MNRLKERFKNLAVHDWVEFACCFVVFVIMLYFSIGMSITLSRGLTLFGDSSDYSGATEIEGPTSSDIIVISLMWVLTVLLLLIWIYMLFFKKPGGRLKVTKEVVHKKVIDIKDDEKKDELSDEEFLSSINKLEQAEQVETETDVSTDEAIEDSSASDSESDGNDDATRASEIYSHLGEYEFIRYEITDDSISFLLVADSEKSDEEEHLNGALMRLTFRGVTSLQIDGEEADSYSYDEIVSEDAHLHLRLRGRNLSEADDELTIDFRFGSLQLESLGDIKEAEA